MDITKIVEALITLIAAVISTFLIPWLKAKLETEKYEQIAEMIDVAVRAAEQIYVGSGRGAEKKEFVLTYLEEKGIKMDIDSINNLIEASVLDLKLNY